MLSFIIGQWYLCAANNFFTAGVDTVNSGAVAVVVVRNMSRKRGTNFQTSEKGAFYC